MNQWVKVVSACMMILTIAACDESTKSTQSTDVSASAKQASSQMKAWSLLSGQLSFILPVKLEDQQGQLDKQASNMFVYTDKSSQEGMVVYVSEAGNGDVEKIIGVMEQRSLSRDAKAQVISKQAISLNGHSAWRLDMIEYHQGRKMYNSTLMMVINTDLITIKLSYTASSSQKERSEMQGIIDSITVKPL